jgi:hypothetical protein
MKIHHRFGPERDAGCAGLLEQGRQQRAVLDHVGKRFGPGLIDGVGNIAVETEKDGAHRIVQAAVGDVHAQDGLRVVRHRLPSPDGLKQPARRRHDGSGPRILNSVRQRGVRDRDPESGPERLAQCQRKGKA